MIDAISNITLYSIGCIVEKYRSRIASAFIISKTIKRWFENLHSRQCYVDIRGRESFKLFDNSTATELSTDSWLVSTADTVRALDRLLLVTCACQWPAAAA
jgi:hypothetical protein